MRWTWFVTLATVVLSGCDSATYERRIDEANRYGEFLARTGQHDRAIASFNEALRLDPGNTKAYVGRGITWSMKGAHDKALTDFNEALQLNPKSSIAYNNRAWLRATCPDAKYRDGKQAVTDATRACELTSWYEVLQIGTLAAAHAEAGDFAKAIEWQTRAVDMAPENKKAGYLKSLDLYRAGKPYREETK
jgi:Flp pilus assembly protein TadD